MQLNAFGAALLRRWYLVVLSLGLAVGASAYVVSNVGPTYEVEGTVLLFPPTSTTTTGDQSITRGNPYLYLGGLNPARDVLIRSLTSRSERDNLAALHPDADYTMESDISTSGPLIVIDVSSGGSAESVAALGTLLDRIPAALEGLQADSGIDSDAYITSQTLTADDRPMAVHKSQIRAGIVTGVGVMALCLLLIGLVDGLLLSAARAGGSKRPDREEAARATPPDQADGGPPDDESVDGGPPEDTAPSEDPPAARAPVPARPERTRPDRKAPAANGTGPVPGPRRQPQPTTQPVKAAKKPPKQKARRSRSRGNLSSVG